MMEGWALWDAREMVSQHCPPPPIHAVSWALGERGIHTGLYVTHHSTEDLLDAGCGAGYICFSSFSTCGLSGDTWKVFRCRGVDRDWAPFRQAE